MTKQFRPFKRSADIDGKAITGSPYAKYVSAPQPDKPHYRYLSCGLYCLDNIQISPHLDYDTYSCCRLWIGKALAIIRDIVYPPSKDRLVYCNAPKRGQQQSTKQNYAYNIEYLQSEFLEEILEIAGCLELKTEIISPIVDLHRYYNQ